MVLYALGDFPASSGPVPHQEGKREGRRGRVWGYAHYIVSCMVLCVLGDFLAFSAAFSASLSGRAGPRSASAVLYSQPFCRHSTDP